MIPSLLQIPSAVSDSKLHSVLPNNGKGDFQFDRSTGATRINKDGLIEEVGYFSSELVQNGNFSELSSELVANGDFATDSDWTLGTGWSISGGKANCDGTQVSNSIFYQNIGNQSNKIVKFSFTISDYVSGVLETAFFGASGTIAETISANGNYTFYVAVQSGHNGNTGFTAKVGFIGSIDNVSVKQVDPNDRWTLGSAWNITDKANFDYSATSGLFTSRIYQSGLDLKSGKKYKLTFDVTTTGSTAFWIGNDSGTVNYDAGGYKTYNTGSQIVIFDMPSDQTTLTFFNNNSDATLDNISLVEVQGDRPRLSYDITNGVVEDKPHLLLEPSRTNLFNYSEPTTNEGAATGVTYESFSWSLGFSNCIKYGDNSVVRFRYGAFVSASTEYTLSAFVVMDDLSEPLVGVNTVTGDFTFVCGGATGGVANENIYYGNNIYRVSTTLTSGANAGNNGIIKYTGQSSKGFRVVGLQVEAGSYSTSYIPTAGTVISRSSETCNNSKPSVNSTEGVLYCEIAALANDGTFREITLNDGTVNDVVELRYNNVDNEIQFVIRDGGSVTVNSQVAFSDVLEYNKMAFQYKANDFKVFANGSEVATDTSGTVPSGLNQLDFSWAESNKFYGKVKGLAVYNEALSESQLMQLTGVTASSIYSNFVTRTASFTVEALNEVKKVIDNL